MIALLNNPNKNVCSKFSGSCNIWSSEQGKYVINWYVVPNSLVGSYQRFGKKPAASTCNSEWWSWSARKKVSTKHCKLRTRTHVVTSNSTVITMFKFRAYFRQCIVSVTTRYRLDGQGIESMWRRDFSHLSRRNQGSTQPPIHFVPGHSRE